MPTWAWHTGGLALASLPPEPVRAAQAVADLEVVLAVRDQFRCC